MPRSAELHDDALRSQNPPRNTRHSPQQDRGGRFVLLRRSTHTSRGTIPPHSRACRIGPRDSASLSPRDASSCHCFRITGVFFERVIRLAEANCGVLPARQAYSHSASVGRRTAFPVLADSFLQNS